MVLPFILALITFMRLSRYSSVYFDGSHSAARFSTSALAISSSGLRMPWAAGNSSGLVSTSSSAKRIIVSTSASSITSSAARCCASRRMNFAMPLRLADRVGQERISARAARGRRQVVRRFEEAIVDLIGLDEVDDVHRPGLVQRGSLEVLLRQHDEAAFFVLVAFDQIFPGHRLAVAHVHPLQPHPRII